MKEIKVKLYTFDELSESAQENVIQDAQASNVWYWDNVSDEISALSDIAYIIGANKKVDYEFSLCSPSYVEFSFSDDVDFDSIKDKRALKYIYNNFIAPFIRGKYYSTKGTYIDGKYHHKFRYSKAIKEFTPASGIYIDYDILDVYKRYIDDFKHNVSFSVSDFISDIESELCKTILDRAEELNSDGYWRGLLSDSDEEIYTEEGKTYHI